MNREHTARLAIAEQAANWLERLPTANTKEREAFVAWLRESPVNVHEFLLAIRCVEQLRYLDSARLMDVQTFVYEAKRNVAPMNENVAAQVQTAAMLQTASAVPTRARRNVSWKVAASFAFLAILCAATGAIYALSARTISTGAGEWQTARLAEGTILRISPQTRVSVEITDRERVLRLAHGGVMAYVAKDATRPFSVETDLAVARAIGTAFAVRRADSARVSITVKEGLVGVTRASHESGPAASSTGHEPIVVSAGQQVQVMSDGAPLRTQAVDVDRELAWTRERLVFSGGTTIADAIRELNLRNRTQIQLVDHTIGQRKVVGVFDSADPLSFVQWLEFSLPLAVVDDHSGSLLLVPHPTTTAPDAKETTEH